MFFIESLWIEDHILEKIESKHRISYEEIEEVCTSETHHVRKGKEGLYKVFGQTLAGRYILVVLAHKGGGDWQIATARAMTENERQLYRKVTGDK
jgi:uncharacterized DUF497 family protein